MLSPNSEWGWKFKAQYLLTLFYSNDLTTAAKLLKDPVPAQFPSLQPRYQYLKAYLAIRQKSPESDSILNSAFKMAVAEKDTATETDALIFMARRDGKRQLELLQQALEIAKRNNLRFQEASVLVGLGLTMKSRERYQEAIQYFSEAASVAQGMHSRYVENTALNGRAGCYLNLGDLDRALQSLQETRSRLRPTDPPGARADVSMQLAEVNLLLQKKAEALALFREAFSIVKADPTLDDYAIAAERLAAALIEISQLAEAEKLNNDASENLKRYPQKDHFDAAFNQLNRGDIALQRKQFAVAETAYNNALQLLNKSAPNAIQWSVFAGLADLKQQQRKNTEAARNFELALNAIEANRSQQRSPDNQITFLSALIRFYQRYVDFLVGQHESARALSVADSSRASVLSGLSVSRQDPDFSSKIHAAVRSSQSAVLFYWLAPAHSYLWAITPGGDEFRELPSSADIETQVRTYSHAIQTARHDTQARQDIAGLTLYRTLIGPVASHLKPDMSVVIVPDGALHGLNFETLLVKAKEDVQPHYWIQDVSLAVAPSLRILLDGSRPQPALHKALLIGGALYGGSGFPPLPASQTEIEHLSALLPKSGTVVLTKKDAVPQAYERAHPENFSLIHISAHVRDNPQSPLDSAIILSQGESGRELYARDLMKKQNHLNADLVTISGCNSVGKTVLKGEGMVGFAWAAFDAGAQNAVTSLWEADDRATTELMDHFYTNVMHGKPYVTALRNAKRQMITGDFRKPYYWASFQLYSRKMGDNAAPLLQSKR